MGYPCAATPGGPEPASNRTMDQAKATSFAPLRGSPVPVSTPSPPPHAVAVAAEGRLGATLARLRELRGALRSGRAVVDPAPLLSELRVDLELHFALEEASSYFGVVLRERQSLSHAIAELRREHELMLGMVEAARAVATDSLRAPELVTFRRTAPRRIRGARARRSEPLAGVFPA